VIAYLPNKGLDATGTTIDLVKGDLADDLVAMLPEKLCQLFAAEEAVRLGNILAELLDLLDLAGELVGEGLLQRL
jgi:hypothetical protein